MKIISLTEEGGTIIIINRTLIKDSGKYTCMIADTRLDQSLVFTLQVLPDLQQDDESSGVGRTWLESSSSLIISTLFFFMLTQ